MCVSLCSLFHLVLCPQGPSVLSQVQDFWRFHSFPWLYLYPCIHWWMLGLFLYLGCYKKCCREHGSPDFFLNLCLWFSSDKHPEVELRSSSSCIFNFLKNFHTIFHSCWSNLLSQQQCTRGSLFPTSLPIILIHSWFHLCILYFLPSCIFIFLPVLQVPSRLFFHLNLFCSNGSLTLFPRGQALGVILKTPS